MSKREEMERARAAVIEVHRQEMQDARATSTAARNEVERLRKEYDSIYQAGLAHLRAWDTIDHANSREAVEAWLRHKGEYGARSRKAREAHEKALNESNQLFVVYKRKKKVVERDEVREAARIARAAERSAQKQQEPRAVARREKKAAQFKEAMEIMRERLADADDFFL